MNFSEGKIEIAPGESKNITFSSNAQDRLIWRAQQFQIPMQTDFLKFVCYAEYNNSASDITSYSFSYKNFNKIEITKPKISNSTISVAIGQTVDLTILGPVKKVSWSTKNKNIAAISPDGISCKVTGKKPEQLP